MKKFQWGWTDVDDLVEFLRARLLDDELSAQRAAPDWPPGDEVASQGDSILVGVHIARWHPARALAEVAAKRTILDTLADGDSGGDSDWWWQAHVMEPILAHMALPYADHEDYRQEWQVTS